jgi:hypothetical protein
MKLKEQEDVELETNRLLSILQHAAKEATPNSNAQRTTNIPYEIKRLRREKLGLPGKELTLRTAEEYLTYTAINLNQNSKKCGINPLNNTFLIKKRTTILFGTLYKIGENPHQHHSQYANI